MKKRSSCLSLFLFCSFLGFFNETLYSTEPVGQRPYEMVDAGRNQDDHPPLVAFSEIDGWTVETVESEATFEKSAEQRIFNDFVAKLTYKNTPSDNPKNPLVSLKPPKPISIPLPFDCVNFWVYGNNWAWESDASTPRVSIVLHLQGNNGNHLKTTLETVRWKEWFLVHKKFPEESLKNLGDEIVLAGIEIQQGRNTEPRTLYFGNLSFYKEELKPLSFEPRPKRGIELPDGQTTGTNTGPGKLPFPNREETILPTNLTKDFENSLDKMPMGGSMSGSFRLSYQGKDGRLEWFYLPKTGTFSDMQLRWTKPDSEAGKTSQYYQLQGDGLRFLEEPKEPGKLVSVKEDGNALIVQWKFADNDVEYRFQMKGKSLIVDVQCKGGKVKEFSSGGWRGLKNAKLVQIPYLVGNGSLRPEVIVAQNNSDAPLFLLSMLDHTRSNASEFFWENKTEKDFVANAACSRYNAKTDGTRNDCFERLFITVSPDFEEVLPNIPNDPSPWKSVTAQRVWRAHGSSNHEHDFEYWNRLHRYGMRKILITDHETMWRDGGESFTFRTYAAPGRGGDDGHKEYTKKIQGLGYIYGPYNNYTDYAPVNGFWNEDWVTRLPGGDFQSAWARCYNPKPAIAVQAEPKITEIVQKKFNFDTAYCDVHTAVSPWQYVDYDARVPGAGTFAATFYAYGEIMLHQKKIWNGPVYSEGNNHWYYSGLTDGNYGQDQAYFVHQSNLPWLVDFDLLKIHPLENNFGMGNPGMFFGNGNFGQMKDKNLALDRFLAATLAFGHTGFLAMETGLPGGIRSYFAVQQIAERYGMQKVKSIRYADETGKFLTSSEALVADQVRLNRIRVEYEDGLTLFVNGNEKLSWNNEPDSMNPIPPNGWFVLDPKKEITAWSLERNGCRTDYVDSPDYLFAEVRDNPRGGNIGTAQRFDRLFCDRQLIVLKNVDESGRYEMIVGEPNYMMRSSIHAVRLNNDMDADAVALDFNGKEISKAETRYSRGMVHVMPVDGTFRYLLAPKPKPAVIASSERIRVVPGETICLENTGSKTTITIPQDAVPGSRFLSAFPNGTWLDFDIVPLCDVSEYFDADKKQILFKINSNLGEKQSLEIKLLQNDETLKTETVSTDPGKILESAFFVELPRKPKILDFELDIRTEDGINLQRKYWLKTDLGFAELSQWPEKFELGQCQRERQPTGFDGKSGAYAHIETVLCGQTNRKAWAIHPPYQGGVGYVFMLSESFTVPSEPQVHFSSEVGIRNGGDASDGVLYRVFVIEDGKEDKLVAELNWSERRWTPLVADLTPWRDKTIRLRLIADVGPNDNSNADWACWSNFKLIAPKPVLKTTLHAESVDLMYQNPDKPIRSPEDFVKAEKIELVYEACGMDASERYYSSATLNGVSLGRMPGVWGDETKDVWATGSIPLLPEVVQSIQEVNRLEIRSDEDCFKIRRFQIVAIYPDGTKRASAITNRTITHPDGWKYAEGETVPMKTPIQVDLFIPFASEQ